jgi:2-keto-4-pentenoate hydratase/2-oxohepta-3-ene-1,7-dioic acid hydratase in catechol pathway
MRALIARFYGRRAPLLAARDGSTVPLAPGTLLAPIPRPARNIMCVGKNYRAHAAEFGGSGFDSSVGPSGEVIPDAPIIFTKVPETVIGDGAPIEYPAVSDALDYEAELAVVIGHGGRGIAKADALRHVFGYTIVDDVTARDWQARHKQWFLGKSFDTFCPMGPWLVTADEVDVTNLDVRCWVNGELRQAASTRDLIFDVPTLIETISAGITLYPGDVIATGTPAGVGIGFTPPRYLRRGDVVEIAITGLGRLSNPVA